MRSVPLRCSLAGILILAGCAPPHAMQPAAAAEDARVGVAIERPRSTRGLTVRPYIGGLGRTAHFALDTGAQETFATQWLLEKAFVPVVSVQRKRIGGMGEDLSYVAQQIPQISFDLPGQTLVLRRVLVYAPAFWTFVHLDGVLGSDIARAGVMRIDASNHLFALSRN